MPITRRQFLAGAGGAAGGIVLAPLIGRAGAAFGGTAPDPATAARARLVVVFLEGGNDGLNTVVPAGDLPGNPRHSVYRKVRPTIAFGDSAVLALDRPGDADQRLGLHPRLAVVHRLYREGRAAVVQGVDYPKHSYSHFTSMDIWHSGEPGRAPRSGWIGRHLDRAGIGDGELRSVAIGPELPLMIRGAKTNGASITSIAATRFGDGTGPEAAARHAALAGYARFPASDAVRHAVGRRAAQTVEVVENLRTAPEPPAAPSAIARQMLTARLLLEQNLGVESVLVRHGGFDTHAGQAPTHDRLLSELDGALEAFYFGTIAGTATGGGPLAADLAQRTLVMVVSEFGRRIGENAGAGAAGTDHGAAAPVLLLSGGVGGVRELVPGVHGEHPKMGTVMAPEDNLAMTTDLRRLYQSVLEAWFDDPDPVYGGLAPLPGLFKRSDGAGGGTAAAAAGAAGRRTQVTVRPGPAGVVEDAVVVEPSASDPADHETALAELRAEQRRLTIGRAADGGLHPVSVLSALGFNAFAVTMLLRTRGTAELRAAFEALRGAGAGSGDPGT